MRPRIDEFPLEEGLLVVVVTDGIIHAGRRRGNPNSEERILEIIARHGGEKSQVLADEILYEAMLLDQNRPCDDMTVTVLQLRAQREGELIRRMGVSFPFRC
jgi:serine phosphatase RsbU (regulator of sigma subunit)